MVVVIRSISIAFGSRVVGVYLGTYRGMKVFFVWLVLLLEVVPRHRSRISCTHLYCASCFDARVYHSWMVVGNVSLAKIFWRIPVLIPSMKYSVNALSSIIFAFPARIRNSATYSSTLFFP